MGAQLHAVRSEQRRHGVEIVLEGIEVEQQGGVSTSSSRMPGSAGGACSMDVLSGPAHDAPRLPADPDVVVVGAGCAGIAAARALARRGLGCVVLEAGARIGGRAWTESGAWAPPSTMAPPGCTRRMTTRSPPMPALRWTTTRCAKAG
jgi:NADPH-dependent 2,4-dienoyl-CoA reductase/sulfur reductase-like enzyme